MHGTPTWGLTPTPTSSMFCSVLLNIPPAASPNSRRAHGSSISRQLRCAQTSSNFRRVESRIAAGLQVRFGLLIDWRCMMAARKKAALKIYELHVELEDIEPVIWRRILVPAKITLPKLHDLLQLVMGWTDSHLHSFEIGDRTFGMDGTDLEELNML